MGRETPIWLGELFDALLILRPRDKAGCHRIARLLGVEPAGLDPESPLSQAMGRLPDDAFPIDEPKRLEPDVWEEPLPDAPVSGVRLKQTRKGGMKRRRARPWPWLADTDPLPMPAKVERRKPRQPDPLLDPRESRAIWAAAFRTGDSPGGIDLEALVAELCAGRPIREVPRVRAPRMAPQVDVLVDLTPAMDPYALDWWALVEDLSKVAGRAAVTTWFFRDCPGRGIGLDDSFAVGDYVPSEAGVATLILSDFGLAPAGHGRLYPRVQEWVDFLEATTAREAFPVGLVPYPRSRWPDALARAAPLIYWDRRTSAGQVHRAVRDNRGLLA